MSILQVANLVKKFGGLAAVNDVSFQLEKGRILGLIGPNGAGKTTCFNMIAGNFKPTSGQITFSGKDITGMKPHALSHLGIARTFQIVKPLRKLTVFDNLMVACLSKSRHVKEARSKAEVFLTKTRLESLRDVVSGTLSIGNQKRLEVARAWATEPELLLMDEPMGGLTPPEVDAAIELIKSINHDGVSIVLIEHIMKAVMAVSDSIVVLQNGEVIATGEPHEVVKQERVIKAYLGDGYVANR